MENHPKIEFVSLDEGEARIPEPEELEALASRDQRGPTSAIIIPVPIGAASPCTII